MKRFLLLIVLILFAGAAVSAQTEPPPADPVPVFGQATDNLSSAQSVFTTATDDPQAEDQLVQLINGLRQQIGGRLCLVPNEILRGVSYDHAKDMHDRNYFDFTDPDGATIFDRALVAGYNATLVGGAISAGTEGIRDTAAEAFADITSKRVLYLVMVRNDWQEIGAGFYSGTLNFEDYWSVIVGKGAGTEGTTCIGTPGPLTHVPEVSTPLNLNTTRPLFRWTQQVTVSDTRALATFYDIEIVDSNNQTVVRAPTDFQGPTYPQECVCQVPDCGLVLDTDLNPGATYDLYVRAYSSEGGYSWNLLPVRFTVDIGAAQSSAEPTSTTCDRPSEVALISPTGTISDPDGNPTYVWNRVDGVTEYEMYVALGNALSYAFIYGVYDAARYCDATTCTLTNAALQNERHRLVDGVYQVYFREWIDGEPATAWSLPSVFGMNAPSPAVVTPDEISYLTGTAVSRPTFNWTLEGTAAQARWFYVYAAPTSNLSAAVTNQWVSRVDACGSPQGTICQLESQSDVLSTGVHDLYIQGWGPGGFGTGGLSNSGFALSTFSVPASVPDVPAGFTVTVVNGRPKIDFSADENAAWYHVRVATSAGATVSDNWILKSPDICDGLTCTLWPSIDLLAGTYQLYLQTWGPAGFNGGSAASESAPQTLDLNVGATGIIANPVFADANTGRPGLQWDAATNATWYNVFISTSNFSKVYLNGWYSSLDLGCAEGGTCRIIPNINLPNGSYTWYVGTWGPGGFGSGGLQGYVQGSPFNVSAAPPTPPQPITPTAGLTVTSANITFQWQHQEAAAWYEVTVNPGGLASSVRTPVHTQWYPAEDLTCRDNEICDLFIPHLGDGFYVWSVRAYTPGGIGDWMPDTKFAVDVP